MILYLLILLNVLEKANILVLYLKLYLKEEYFIIFNFMHQCN